jgi:hypothetical protein
LKQNNELWAEFEDKLGITMLDEAANNLKIFTDHIDAKRNSIPASLNFINDTGLRFTRPNGINVISLA